MFVKFFSLITLLASVLVAPRAQSSDVDHHRGKWFKIDQARQCFQEFEAIKERLLSVSDFQILEGGCVRHDLRLRVEFSYLKATKGRLKTHNLFTSNANVCQELAQRAQIDFEGLSVSYIDGYCESDRFKLTFFDSDYYLIKNFRPQTFAGAFYFEEQKQCQDFIAGLEGRLKPDNVHLLLSTCLKYKVSADQGHVYKPEFSYLALFNRELSFFTGKECETGEECLSDRRELEQKLPKSGLKFIDSLKAAHGSKYVMKEQVVYLSLPTGKRIKEFVGSFYYAQDYCQEQLQNALSGLQARSTNNILYGFCQKSISADDIHRYRPVIYYADTLIQQ